MGTKDLESDRKVYSGTAGAHGRIWGQRSNKALESSRKVCRSIARNIARRIARSIARSIGRSIARSTARSIARSITRSILRSIVRSIATHDYRRVRWKSPRRKSNKALESGRKV